MELQFGLLPSPNIASYCRRSFWMTVCSQTSLTNMVTCFMILMGGQSYGKLRHPMPDINGPVDPHFNHPFIAKSPDASTSEPVSSWPQHPGKSLQHHIHEHWLVFNERGVFIPDKNYECVIILEPPGPLLSRRSCMVSEEQSLCDIVSWPLPRLVTYDRSWMAVGYSRHHLQQDPIKSVNIKDFIWPFCANNIPLNKVTHIIAYPIPSCGLAVFNSLDLVHGCGCLACLWGTINSPLPSQARSSLHFKGLRPSNWSTW